MCLCSRKDKYIGVGQVLQRNVSFRFNLSHRRRTRRQKLIPPLRRDAAPVWYARWSNIAPRQWLTLVQNGSGKSNILDAICFVLGITNLQAVRARHALACNY